jgi:hypothetical protein
MGTFQSRFAAGNLTGRYVITLPERTVIILNESGRLEFEGQRP